MGNKVRIIHCRTTEGYDLYRSHALIFILVIESSEKSDIISVSRVNSANILKIEHIIYLCIKPDMRDFETNRCLTFIKLQRWT